MKHRMIVAVFIIPILLLTSACNLPYAVPQTGMPPSDKINPPVAPASTATDTATLPPLPTPSVTLTPTPPKPSLRVATDTNCRTGPGKVYDWVGGIQVGETADIFGRDPGGQYYYIRNPDKVNDFCWIWGAYATPSGDLSGLPVFTPPPTPTPPPTAVPTATPTATRAIIFVAPSHEPLHLSFRVSAVTVSVDRASYSGPCPHRANWSGTITTNGAGTVAYLWEESDSPGVFSPTLQGGVPVFDSASTKATVPFWIETSGSTVRTMRIHVSEPNDIYSNEVSVSITCTP